MSPSGGTIISFFRYNLLFLFSIFLREGKNSEREGIEVFILFYFSSFLISSFAILTTAASTFLLLSADRE
jgi:hypothetical protein